MKEFSFIYDIRNRSRRSDYQLIHLKSALRTGCTENDTRNQLGGDRGVN